MGEQLVTVVVPARDEEEFIGPCLDSILAQDDPNLQVIVVDGASRDRTREVVHGYMRRDARIELLVNPAGIVPTSLNAALESARGRWFVRVDAHAAVPPNYVRTAVAWLRTGRWGGVGGRKDGVGRTAAGRAIAAAMGSRFGVGNSTYHYGTRVRPVEHIPFGAYPTSLIRDLGGWDERCRVNQDFELDYRVRRAGRQLLFDPSLAIRWHCRQSLGDLFRQYRRYGRGKAFVARLHPRSLRTRHLVAPALVLACVVEMGLAFFSPVAAALLAAPYLLGLGVASALAGRGLDPAARLRVPLAFLCMHVGWGVGFWEGLAETVLAPASHLRA
jgi:cellulose synthase/poly-beta-1,6-N-acetylglucosamine synthase-like glycosyltransferase